ncbi:MAG: exosortase A [Nitrospirota bacterium]
MQVHEENNFFNILKRHRIQLIVTVLLVCGLYYSVIPPMVRQWYEDPNYSHGFIVPFIAAYFLYKKYDTLKKVSVSPNNSGLSVIIFSLLMLTIANLGTEYFTLRASLIFLLAGLVLYLFGKEVFKLTLLPLFYLFFMVPLPYIVYDSIAFPLKLFVAKYSVLTLQEIGIDVWREGNIIIFSDTMLEVADACSGIRSLMSLLALGVAYAFVSHTSNIKKLVIILSAIPLSIFANGLRVIVTGILTQYWGVRAAHGFFHEFSGLSVFGLAFGLLLLLGVIIKKIGR